LRVELAGFLVDGGRFEEALGYLREALPELESAHGTNSRELALGQFHLGRALMGLDASGARAHLGRAVDSLRRSPFRHQYAAEISAGEGLLRTPAPGDSP
ncbi:MAG: hypothetical protein AAGD06_15400, partial [Acidobacteriota bacterium]